MLLAIDMGNTQIEVGILEGEKILLSERMATDLKKTSTEYAVFLEAIFRLRGIRPEELEGGIITSVVPPLTFPLKEAVKLAAGFTPLLVEPGVKNGLKICIDDPKTLGADLVVGAVAAICRYGAPVIIIDMGTATTLSVVDSKKNYRGGLILTGMKVAADALTARTAQLPKVNFEVPSHVIGTNTIDCLKSGILYSNASALDGIIDRIEDELGEKCTAVATGGLSELVVPLCRREIILDNNLLIKGLAIIYKKNRK